VALSGCAASLLSAAGPSYSTLVEAKESETITFEIVELSASTIGPYMLEELTVDTSLVLDGVLSVTLAPGDVLTVMLAQTDKEPAIFAALSGGGTRFSDVRVDHNGNIEIPYVGRIKAQGLTTIALAERIKKKTRDQHKAP